MVLSVCCNFKVEKRITALFIAVVNLNQIDTNQLDFCTEKIVFFTWAIYRRKKEMSSHYFDYYKGPELESLCLKSHQVLR